MSGDRTTAARAARWAALAASLWLAAAGDTASAAALDLVGRRGEPLPIVLAAGAIPAERTAARELSSYLTRVAGVPFAIVAEGAGRPGPAIHVGPTAAVRRADPQAGELGPEEWIVRRDGERLMLYGGRPRGTLYAVYHFLEDEIGVRWWSPFEETVPRRRKLAVGRLDVRASPAFPYRDVLGIDGPRPFCARNRMSGHFSRLPAEYGGRDAYGPPWMAHTFFLYVPPETYFQRHPEFFSEIDGVRTAEKAQLCLTNSALLDLVTARLVEAIEQGRSDAAAAGEAAPRLYDFSPNDWGNPCGCSFCRALAEREGSEAAPLVAFVNGLADRIRVRYPEVLLDTLAYYYTFPPPRRLELRDNVVVRLAALQRRNFARPVRDAVHAEYRDAIEGWRRVTRHLRIWDYSVTFGNRGDLPLPNLPVLADDYRYYLDHGIEGMFVQHDHPIGADMRDLKLWVLLKLLEDPARDLAALVRDFTDGFYGPAGPDVRRYLRLLERAAERRPAEIGYPSRPADYRYLDLDTVVAAQRLFDRASRRVADRPELGRRVRHARLALDRATLWLLEPLGREWHARGRPQDRRPPDPADVVRRYRRTWYEQIALRIPGRTARGDARSAVDDEIGRMFRGGP